MSADNKNIYWLVKSGGRILGPMVTDEVIQSLRSKEIVPLDEIARSFGRWHYIRDNSAFQSTVNELRNRRQSGESTYTGTGTATSADNTATDITERLSAFGPADRLTSGISEQVSERRMTESRSHESESPTKTYGYSGDENFRKTVKRPQMNLFMWMALIIITGGITLKLITTLTSRGVDSPEVQADMAIALSQAGEFNKSLSSFRKGISARKDANYSMAYAHALLAEKQPVEARNIFESIPSLNPSPEQVSQIKLGKSIASILELDFSSAKKQLSEILLSQPKDTYALANLGVIALNEGRHKDAAELFLNSIDAGVSDDAIPLLLAEASYLSFKIEGVLEGAIRAKSVLAAHIQNARQYVFEAAMMLMHLQIEAKEESAALKTAELILNLDPNFTDDHRKSAYLVRDRILISQLAKYLKTDLHHSHSPVIQAALGLAIFKGLDQSEGRRLIEEAQSKAPTDRLVRAALAYVQAETDRDEDALVSLAVALEGGDLELPMLTKARLCLKKKDFICAEEQWKNLLAKNESSVVALGGMAWIFILKGMTNEAKLIVSKGLSKDVDYTPLIRADLKLKGRIE